MRVAWADYGIERAGGPGGIQHCQGRGYSNICRRFREGLELALGPDFRVIDSHFQSDGTGLVLHLCPSDIFAPIPGERNVLFSMWEAQELPAADAANMLRADAWLVPSVYCQRVWHRHGARASVVPLGVSDAFMRGDIARPQMPRTLRFLWIGSDQRRKGWQLIGPAWMAAFANGEDVALTIKCIGDGSTESHYGGRVVIDRRDLSEDALAALYREHDVFVFPSYGEGFGLPVLEAMASGCLVVAPESSSLGQFVSDRTAVPIQRSRRAVIECGVETRATVHGVDDLASALRTAYEGWEWMDGRRQAAAKMARAFTWASASLKLRVALDKIVYAGERVMIVPRPVQARAWVSP